MARSEHEPTHSSSGEEDDDVSPEGSNSESESEPDKTTPLPPSSKKPQPTPHSSSDESNSDSETDTDPSPKTVNLADPKTKPSDPKPGDADPPKKSRSKTPTSRYSPSPIKTSTGKRSAAESEGRDLKRASNKTTASAASGGEKKLLFQRLWSEDDETELIQGMINYVSKKGKDPIADVNNFHEFVKKSLNVDVSNRQVSAKVRRLKQKFENNVGRAVKIGKVRSFSNPHEKKMYELSTKLWGKDSDKDAVVGSCSTKEVNQSRRKKKAPVLNGNGENGGHEMSAIEVEQNVERSTGLLGQPGLIRFPITDEEIMSRGLELLSGYKKVEMEEKWNDLKVQEVENFLKRVELMKEQTELVLSAIRKS